MRFEDLDLPPEVMRGIEDVGFVECTPIQAQVLPWSLEGDDVAGQAQTGTGKTATFLFTVFKRLLTSQRTVQPHRPRAMIIAPTRELAEQIADDATVLGRHTGLSIQTIYGGVGYTAQRRSLDLGVDLVIGTPGRIIDYLKRREIKLSDCEALVIDEADRMFDMGFVHDLRFILRRLPPRDKRQMMLFSATLNFTVMELAYEFMEHPREFQIAPEQVVVETIDEVLYHVGAHEKLELLLGLIRDEQPRRCLVFCNTKVGVDVVCRRLQGNGHAAAQLSGDLPQSKRLQTIELFKSGDLHILVATDVASRGLHVEDVTHVVNYDVPQDAEDYVHRVGRTARMGGEGRAITLACERFVLNLPAVERYIKHKIPVSNLTDDMFGKDVSPPVRRHRRGRGSDPQRRSSRSGNRGSRGSSRGSGGPSGGSGSNSGATSDAGSDQRRGRGRRKPRR